MVAINNPLMDAEMDDQTRAYVGILERQVVGLTVTVSKQKAIIEVLAGQPVDDLLVNMEEKEVRDIVTQVIQAKNPELSIQEAKKLARERMAEEPEPEPA